MTTALWKGLGDCPLVRGQTREEWPAAQQGQWTSVLLSFLKGLRLKVGVISSWPLSTHSLQVMECIYTRTNQKNQYFSSHICCISFPLSRNVSGTRNKLSRVLIWCLLTNPLKRTTHHFKCLLEICERLVGILSFLNRTDLLCAFYRNNIEKSSDLKPKVRNLTKNHITFRKTVGFYLLNRQPSSLNNSPAQS